jgi:hypothetical protein
VDPGVVAFAEQRRVLEVGLAAEQPVHDVMDLAPPAGSAAAGEHAGLVAQLDRFAQAR